MRLSGRSSSFAAYGRHPRAACAIIQTAVDRMTGRGTRLDLIKHFLEQHPYFRDLSDAEIDQIARLGITRTLTRGEILSLEGDPLTAVYFVLEGRIQAIKTSPQGREQVVSELTAGQSFYIVPALDNDPLPTTTRAATRATLVSFSCSDFLGLLHRYPSLAMQVLLDFARRLRQLSTLVENLSLRSVPGRLARLLLERATAPTGHRMTQREMAAQLGTVREVVARSLLQFEEQGLIHLHRGVIEIVNFEALQHIASR
jgi:CRP/FNR family transcriptional regulator, cyclic AMP receptor protein